MTQTKNSVSPVKAELSFEHSKLNSPVKVTPRTGSNRSASTDRVCTGPFHIWPPGIRIGMTRQLCRSVARTFHFFLAQLDLNSSAAPPTQPHPTAPASPRSKQSTFLSRSVARTLCGAALLTPAEMLTLLAQVLDLMRFNPFYPPGPTGGLTAYESNLPGCHDFRSSTRVNRSSRPFPPCNISPVVNPVDRRSALSLGLCHSFDIRDSSFAIPCLP